MDLDQPMMKSSREFIRSEDFAIYPDSRTGDEIPNRLWDLCGRDIDACFA